MAAGGSGRGWSPSTLTSADCPTARESRSHHGTPIPAFLGIESCFLGGKKEVTQFRSQPWQPVRPWGCPATMAVCGDQEVPQGDALLPFPAGRQASRAAHSDLEQEPCGDKATRPSGSPENQPALPALRGGRNVYLI